ncbi:MAG: HAD-IA family hydrolase [Thermoleophilia bacterium]|nr:HAD-IA family hydrolase [Thermoleophilia bacterium]
MPSRTPSLVTFDAFGTLVRMDPPAPVLAGLLADAGYAVDDRVVEAALQQEIGHYRAHMHMGADAAGLAALRAQCGAVLARALGPGGPGPEEATETLVHSLHFHLYDDALPALDALADRGTRVAVVSNWDCALPHHLERLGVADRFVVIAASAAVGAAKPDPAIFLHAVRAAGVQPGDAVHVGDRRAEDLDGARAAGLRALLLDREGHGGGPEVIRSLAEVPGRTAA